MIHKTVKCGKLNISNTNAFTLIAGPCQLENEKHALEVATELKKQNIYFAGIDFIQSKLIGDINVTSPTGLKTYYDLTGINLAKYFFDNI